MKARTIAVVALLAVFAGKASAQQDQGFKSPSGNILCAYFDADEGLPASLRCDILQTSTRKPPRPRDCELEWGNAFELKLTGRGGRLCHGDTLAGMNLAVLPYGQTWTKHNITCFSAESGITCRNSAGGGFELARAKQRAF